LILAKKDKEGNPIAPETLQILSAVLAWIDTETYNGREEEATAKS